MPVPKVKRMRHKSPDEVIKLHHVMYILRGMGYDVDDARSVICVIDMFNLDKSQFDFPYGSYDKFKQHVNAGKFDINEYSAFATKEECQELDKAVKEGKLWVTH